MAVWVVVAVAMLSLSAAPVAAYPQPVIPSEDTGEDPGPEEPGDGDAPEPPSDPQPPDPPMNPGQPCEGAAAGTDLARAATFGAGSDQRRVAPRPVVPTGPGGVAGTSDAVPTEAHCATELQLVLNIRSRTGDRPQNVDAILDGLTLSQSTLEGGYDVTLPSGDHFVSLARPDADWEVTETFCTCTPSASSASAGAVAAVGAGQALSAPGFPGPVLPIDTGSVSIPCGSATASAADAPSATATTSATGSTLIGPSSGLASSPSRGGLAIAPRPVLPSDDPPDGFSGETLPGDGPPPATLIWNRWGDVTISDPYRAGGVFLCEWTVEKVIGDLTIETVTEPQGEEGRFSYRVTPGFDEPVTVPRTLAGVPPAGDTATIRKGGWSVELLGLDDDWQLDASSCTEADGSTVSASSGLAASIGMDPGDEVRCRFEISQLQLRPGPWVAENRRGLVACSNVPGLPSIRLPAVTESVRIRVRQGGAVLQVTGYQGRTLRLRRDPDDVKRYTGRVAIPVAQVRPRYTVTLRVIDRTTAVADLYATFRYAATRCTASREVRLRFAGR